MVEVYVVSAFSKGNAGGNKAGIVLDRPDLEKSQKIAIAKTTTAERQSITFLNTRVCFIDSFVLRCEPQFLLYSSTVAPGPSRRPSSALRLQLR